MAPVFENWGAGYFSINSQGHLIARPAEGDPRFVDIKRVVDDLLARRERFRNEVVIASHFSTRYTDDRIRRILAKRIPDMLDGRLQVWL